MHPQLAILLEIQDLRMQHRELAAEDAAGTLEKEHFHIEVEEALRELEAKIGELEEQLEPRIRDRYRRMKATRDRVVVPVIGGTCYGCFVSIPTATGVGGGPGESLTTCENCGCFLYILP